MFTFRLVFEGENASPVALIRILRLIRIVRVLKLARYTIGIRVIGLTIRNSFKVTPCPGGEGVLKYVSYYHVPTRVSTTHQPL